MRMSESIVNLAVALQQFNLEVSAVTKAAENPFFKSKYATLDQIIENIRPILAKHGISVMQPCSAGDGANVVVKTILIHCTGEWMETGEISMRPVDQKPQTVGSTITYARRYSLASALSLNTSEDDDGNKGTHGDDGPKQSKQSGIKLASDKQLGMLQGKMKEYAKAHSKDDKQLLAATLQKLGIATLTELSSSKASELIKQFTVAS